MMKKKTKRTARRDKTEDQGRTRTRLLKADVTANSDDDRALLKRFQLFGPPGTIFFDASGRELAQPRVIGFQNAERFGRSLDAAGL